MAAIISAFTVIVAGIAFIALAVRWHHEGLEEAVEDLTTDDVAKSRGVLWTYRNEPTSSNPYAEVTNVELPGHHFTVLWALERTWIRRERHYKGVINKLLTALGRLGNRNLQDFDTVVKPHVAACLNSCMYTRATASYADDRDKIDDRETLLRLRLLGDALKLDAYGCSETSPDKRAASFGAESRSR